VPSSSFDENPSSSLELIMRHWNDIAGTLSKGEVHLPLPLLNENSVEHGDD
jgi:hypothetical protein